MTPLEQFKSDAAILKEAQRYAEIMAQFVSDGRYHLIHFAHNAIAEYEAQDALTTISRLKWSNAMNQQRVDFERRFDAELAAIGDKLPALIAKIRAEHGLD